MTPETLGLLKAVIDIAFLATFAWGVVHIVRIGGFRKWAKAKPSPMLHGLFAGLVCANAYVSAMLGSGAAVTWIRVCAAALLVLVAIDYKVDIVTPAIHHYYRYKMAAYFWMNGNPWGESLAVAREIEDEIKAEIKAEKERQS